MSNKESSRRVEFVTSPSSPPIADLSEVNTDETDNYHGLHARTALVYLSITLITAAQILNLVGSGAFASNVAAVVGGSSEQIWLSQVLAILTCVIIIARSTSMGMAIAGEAICGLGFGTQPLLYTVASEILPRRYRPIAQGGMNVAINMAGAFGLLVGSVIIKEHSEGFRIYWYLSAGLMGVSALVCFLLYNPSPRPLQLSLTLNEKLERLDWVGYFLLVSGIVLFGMALTWSDNPYSWGDAHILAPFVLGLAFLLGLAIHNGFYKRNGLFHHALFKKDRNFALAMLAMFVEGMSFFAANNFFALEMSLLFETDPVRVGLRFSIVFFTAILSASCVATYASAKKDIRTPTVLSFVAFLIFDVLMATVDLSSSTNAWGHPVFLGLGIGGCLVCIVTAAQLGSPPDYIAISSGLIIATRSLGGSITLPIYNSVFNSHISKDLPRDVANAVLPLGLKQAVLPDFIAALSANDQAALISILGVTPQIISAGAHGLKTAICFFSTLRVGSIWCIFIAGRNL
ncbi:major facilitator superfamily domain-containing protein [Ilyonectria robusta]|uniref:major facilitator superfamily domain-containing protein n=1 Tax=Ilyonectria robusta TaxID=1079257 RepID=UPI001E8E875D|nr:major facilitator superfamily domain-containing protein [Ilyonectria robusta]KAH8683881.1 major facilitator superfamily domain-containing protein [Ilyonectria robusta]